MKIFALSGYKQSGKDTCANHLISKGFIRVSFADPLKDMVSKTYNIPRNYLDDPKYKEMPLEQYPVIPKDKFTLELSKILYGEFKTINGHRPSDYHIDVSNTFLGVIGKDLVQLYWSPRSLAILEGSVKRTVTTNYWVETAIKQIQSKEWSGFPIEKGWSKEDIDKKYQEMKDYNNKLNFVISDLRYRSEIEQLKAAFGKDLITVRINRFDSCASEDPSERELDNSKFDIVIENKGSVEDLYSKLEELVK